MPGDDENRPPTSAAAEHIHAELERAFGPTTGNTQKMLRGLSDVVGEKLDALAVEAMASAIKAEAEEDRERAAKRGLNMDTSTIDYEALARDTLTRGRRKVATSAWKHPLPPPGWMFAPDGIGEVNCFYKHRGMRLAVGLSCELENDGRAWIHLSVSHRDRVPTWGELAKAKADFLGDIEAYQVLPPKARYVNIDPRVLNIYAPLNGPVLPDFTRGTGGI